MAGASRSLAVAVVVVAVVILAGSFMLNSTGSLKARLLRLLP